jgi:hypothetical protein
VGICLVNTPGFFRMLRKRTQNEDARWPSAVTALLCRTVRYENDNCRISVPCI